MREHPIVLTPAEQLAHQNGTLRVLIRVAEVSPHLGAPYNGHDGWYQNDGISVVRKVANPLGNKGDVLVWIERKQLGEACKTHRLPVTSVELVRLHDVSMADSYPDEEFGGARTYAEFITAWNLSNPDHPWASNPMVWKVGVEK